LQGYGILLGRNGYTCVTCEYRLSGEAKWPAQLEDVKTARCAGCAPIASSSASIPTRSRCRANSAGAHLSLMLAATQNISDYDGNGGHTGVSAHVSAAIAFYAPTNLGVPADPTKTRELAQVVAGLLGSDRSIERIRGASPITYVRADFPPTMLMTGKPR
jgi:acetyl esterase/lipase